MPVDVMTKSLTSLVLLFSLTIAAAAQMPSERDEARSLASDSLSDSVEARNKALARAFYEDLWLSNRTGRYDRYVADEYVVHDIGERKNVTEAAIRQKEIADFFHAQGDLTGHIDYHIAEGDLVATRWQVRFEPASFWMRLMSGRDPIPIINVFRFHDGKIVEIWNHRHDIDTWRGNLPFAKGLGIGLLVALLGWGVAFVQWRRRTA
jgi:predicted SnoaL-like aldol condensation-catalyzing enzyme